MEDEISHEHKHPITGKKLIFVTILNFSITAAEIGGGLISGSLSLISDAFHNLTDGLAVVISYIALKVGEREHNLKFTFGYKRIEIMAALLNASVLLIISFFLFKEAYIRFFNPHPIKGILMLVVALIGLIANLVAVLILKEGAEKNINIKSAYLHLFADTLSSVVVVVGGILIYFFKIYWIDPVFTIIIGGYVLYESIKIVKKAFDVLMEKAPSNVDIKSIKEVIEKMEGVNDVHHIHLWQINEDNLLFEAHVDVNKNMNITETTSLIKHIEKVLGENFGINHTTIQIECNACVNKEIVSKGYVKVHKH